MGRRRAAPGTALHRQDPPETELAGKTAACSRAPCFMAPVLATGQFPFISRYFHAHGHIVINFFYAFEAGLKRFVNAGASTAWRLFKRPGLYRFRGANLLPKTSLPDAAEPITSRFFHVRKLAFSR